MATLSETNNFMNQITKIDLEPDDLILFWVLRKFEELEKESLSNIFDLMKMLANPEIEQSERSEIYITIREILYPEFIGKVKFGISVQEDKIPNNVKKRTIWIGGKVKKYREEKGWTQKDLSDRSGLRQPQISRLEAGIHSPSYKTIEKLANALGVSAGDLDPSN